MSELEYKEEPFYGTAVGTLMDVVRRLPISF